MEFSEVFKLIVRVINKLKEVEYHLPEEDTELILAFLDRRLNKKYHDTLKKIDNKSVGLNP